MKRFWNGIELPIGVTIYDGARTKYIILYFMYNGRKREEKFIDDGFSEINAEYVAEAGKALAKIKRQIDAGKFIFEHWFPQSRSLNKKKNHHNIGVHNKEKQIRFTEFVELFFVELLPKEKKKKRSPATLYGYLKMLRQMGRYFDQYNLDEIGIEEIESWVISLEGKIVKATLRKRWSLLTMILAGAKNKRLIKINPIKNIELDYLLLNWEAKQQKSYSFDPDQLKEIMSHADKYETALFSFWEETGLRTSEIICLTWSDILWEERKLDVNKAKVVGIKDIEYNEDGSIKKYKVGPIKKGNKTDAGDRYVPLSKRALEMLRLQYSLIPHEDDDPIFINPNTNKSWNSDKPIREYWYRLVARAGYNLNEEKLNPYKFRNTFCVREMQNNVDIISIKDSMGHADLSPIINNYGKSAPVKKRKK